MRRDGQPVQVGTGQSESAATAADCPAVASNDGLGGTFAAVVEVMASSTEPTNAAATARHAVAVRIDLRWSFTLARPMRRLLVSILDRPARPKARQE